MGGLARSRKPEVWADRFVSEKAYGKFREWWPQRSLTLERQFITKDLSQHNPNVLKQFTERKGWKWFTFRLKDANEYLVKEFYANVAHIKKGTKVTKVRNLKIRFDGHALNIYVGFEEVEAVQYLEKLALGEAVRPWLAEILAIPGTTPAWLTAGVQIVRATLNFEAKGWATFVCSRLDPCQHENVLPLPRAVLVASIMAGYPINVGNLMSYNISNAVQKEERSYPYPNFLTEYFQDQGVETRHFDVELIQMLSNPVVPQSEDVEIQLEDTECDDEPMHAEDPVHVEDPMQTETT